VTNFASAARQGAAAFGDAGVFVEKYVQVRGRTGEGWVQVVGDLPGWHWLVACLDRQQRTSSRSALLPITHPLALTLGALSCPSACFP
jgi:biotin carboxylase